MTPRSKPSMALVGILALSFLILLGGATVAAVGPRQIPHLPAAWNYAPAEAPTGTCTVTSAADSGPGTLRACLQNAVSGDLINFDPAIFPPSSPVSITVATDLPPITQGNLTIDAGDAGVILDGSSVVPNTGEGLYVISDGNLIQGLQIFYFPGDGIEIYGGSNNTIADNVIGGNKQTGVGIAGSGATNNRVVGNRIGTDASGTKAVGGHPLCAVRIGAGAQYNTVGGDTEAERNLISGNDDDGVCIGDSGTMYNTVSGNYIGTDISGTTALPNASGVSIGSGAQYNTLGGSNHTPGGACTGECNLISGNHGGVMLIRSGTQHNVISGNYIGTDPSGTFAVPNEGGIWIVDQPQYNVIGGTTPGERNVISGNLDPIGGPGIWIQDPGADHNVIIGNFIGTDASGLAALPNGGGGVVISDGAGHNTVGGTTREERNLISGNSRGAIGLDGVHNVVAGNYIGVDVTGLAALANGGGIGIQGTYNRVGGSTPGERNVISGNDAGAVYIEGSGTMSNTVLGNYIGTDADGEAVIPNGWGVQIWNGAQRNRVGGSAPGEGNLISGNGGDGIIIEDNGTFSNTVSGNYIGTDASGSAALGNDGYGVHIHSAASYNLIGGDVPGRGNLISGNTSGGIGIGNGDSNHNRVSGNYIGTDAGGTAAIPNGGDGVSLWWNASWNQIGGSNGTPGTGCSGDCNVISGNQGNGVSISNPGATNNTVSGNYIGTDVNGTAPVSNGEHGVALDDGSSDNLIGGDSEAERNLITYNFGDGISLAGSGTSGNRIAGNWIGVDADGTRDLDVSVAAYSPDYATDGTVFLGCYEGGLFKTTDRGAHWSEVESELLEGRSISGLAVSPAYATDHTLFVVAGALLKSADGGATWQDVSPIPGLTPRSLALSPDYGNDQTLLAGHLLSWAGGQMVGGVFKSTDGGLSWVQIDFGDAPGQASAVATAGQMSACFTADPALWWLDCPGRTELSALVPDPGDQTQVSAARRGDVSPSSTEVAGRSVAFSPDYAHDRTLFVGTWGTDGSLFKSVDDGATWTVMNAGLDGSNASQIVISPDYGSDGTLYVMSTGSGAHPYRSTDGGATWNLLTAGLPADDSSAVALVISPGFATDDTLYVAYLLQDPNVGAFFRSVDRGDGWAATSPGLQHQHLLRSVAVSPDHAADDELLLAAGANGLLRSPDRGDTWFLAGGDLTDPGNASSGVGLHDGAQGNLVGGSAAGEGNLISNNGYNGVTLDGAGTSDNGVLGNYIGTDASGTDALANAASGVRIRLGASDNTIGGVHASMGGQCSGVCNLISGNAETGVLIEGSGTVSNTVSGNYIGTDLWGMDRNDNSWWGVLIDDYAAHNTVGGVAEGAGNLISGNSSMALSIRDSSDNQVLGNLVGTDASGTAPLSNGGGLGVYFAKRNLLEYNVIASNGLYGLQIAGPDATDNLVRGNWIGTNRDGHVLGNTWGGIEITSQAGTNAIGPDNVIKYNELSGVSVSEGHDNLLVDNEIAYNGEAGVDIWGSNSLRNTITENSIYANEALGIDLEEGGNTELPAPVVTHYDLAAGTASGTACAGCAVEVFADDGDEGRWFITGTVAGPDGAWSIDTGDPFPGIHVHATATDADGNTSEFSLSADTCPLVSSPADSGPGTLRRCLETAEVGELITFDTSVFPPGDPTTIALLSELPRIVTDSLTIDGSNAGVIVDGSQVGATPEIVLLDDISLTLDGGPNLINNGDFSSGLDYWQASDEHPGATRTLNSSDYFSAPPSLEWGLVAHTRESSTNYTEWISAAEGNTIVMHLWYRYGRVAVNVDARFADDDDTIREQWLPWQADWTEATIVETVPPGATAVSVSFVSEHSEMRASGLASTASGVTIQGLQVVNFPGSGIWLLDGAQYALIGGDSTLGVAPLGQGNLLSGNYANGIRIEGVGTMSNTVSGNWIGTDASGTSAFGNLEGGVLIIEEAANNLIGGQTEGERNVITYNHGDGVGIENWGTNENRIEGNWIGVDADGTRDTDVSLVAYSPAYASDGTIFLGTEGQGVWKSTDSGVHWAEMNKGLTDLNVTAMAVSPNYAVDGTLFAGTDSGVFQTTDGGTSWVDVSPASGGDSIRSVALSPDYGSDQTVLLGDIGDAQVGGLWKSTDGGATWQNVAPASGSQQEVRQADAVDRWAPGADPWLDGIQWEPGLWDGERAQVPALQDGGLVAGTAVAFSPDYATDQTMFVGGYDSGYNGLFFKSEDGGGTWARIDSGLGGTQVDTIAVSPDYGSDGTLFVIRNTFFGLPYRSTNGGATWTQLTNGLPDDYSWAHGLVLSPGFAADGTLFIPYGWGHMGVRGLFRSSDRGDTWIRTSPGVLRQQALGMVAVSPEFVTDEELLLAVGRNGLLRSTDRGDTWAYANGDLTDPGNDGHGVGIYDRASGNVVGGSTAGQRNLISNNGFHGILLEEEGTSQNVISGNYIGTNADGSSGLGNRTNGVEFGNGAYDNRIGGHNPAPGGTCSGECNLISGNGADGITINSGSDDNTMSGNYIGMGADGTTPIGNGYYGINVYSGDNLVGGENGSPGGACSGACNLISGNVHGLQIVGYSAISNTVTGNYIGTDVNGTTAIPSLGWDNSDNLQIGGAHNRIGGATPAERNVIAGPIDIAPPYMEPTHNQIIGNYLGVDATGTACIANGHLGIGVWGSDHVIGGDTPAEGNWICGFDRGGISVNATGTTIAHNKIYDTLEEGIWIGGSGNLVAHNEIYGNSTEGVRIEGETALTNTLTQNSIYDNDLLGIDLVDGGNTELWAPVPLATDVTAGTASGTACVGCTVEVFSDDGDEGRWFEGTAKANGAGDWSFSKGSPFTGAYVHATATDADGNTSEFSRPVHDVAVVSAVPGGEVPVGQPAQVRAELFNGGSYAESDVPVRCTFEGTTYQEDGSSGEIQIAAWAWVDLPAWTPAAAGTYTITCESLLDDENPKNDRFSQVVTATLDAPPDVWTRDNPADDGDVPSGHPWWVSPDIWVRHQPDGGLVHQNPIAFQENTIYVRLRNRGGRAASGQVQVFWDRSRLGWPCKVEEPNVGIIQFEDLAPGEVRIVSLPWVPQEVGEHGLHTVIEAGGDPAEWSAPCSPHRPRWDNNVSWRNVIVFMQPLGGAGQALAVEEAEVVLANPYDWPKGVDLLVQRRTFPTAGTIVLRLDGELFDRWWSSAGRWYQGAEVDEGAKLITVTGAVSATVGGLPLAPREEVTAALTFDAPQPGWFAVTLAERIDGQVVGGLDYWWIFSDTLAPTVEATSPAGSAVEVALTAPIVITFSEEIGPLSFGLVLEPDPGGAHVAWNEAGTVFTVTHSGFDPATTYTAAVEASDAFANPMEAPYTWSFTTREGHWIYLPIVAHEH